jgi:hypothetical protein
MRRRLFVLSLAASDLLALILAWTLASLVVFNTALFWTAPDQRGESIMPLLGLMLVGLAVGSYVSRRMWADGVPRPSYGRGLAIVGGAVVFTAVGMFFLLV